MSNVTIPQVEGGETTSPLMSYTMELDTGATSVYAKLSSLMKLAVPNGTMINGKLSPTVASSNITLAIKTLAGNDPSASDPVLVKINGTTQVISGALSVTRLAGTNWFNSGSAELATQEVDYFVYLGYNAADGVVIGFARIPYANQYGDFSATSTNEKYLAIPTANIANAASTDYYEVIGRFAATLSASASYNWSVPSFTASNLVQKPIYESRWLTWAPQHSRSVTGYTNAPSIAFAKYLVTMRAARWKERHNQNATPGGSGNATFTVPFTSTSGDVVASINTTATTPQAALLSSATVTNYTDLTASNQYSLNGIIEI